MDNPNLILEADSEPEEDIDAVDIMKIECDEGVKPVFTASTTVNLNCVVFMRRAVGNPQIHLEVKGKVRVQYEGRTLDDLSSLRKSKRRKIREKIIFIRPIVLSPGKNLCYMQFSVFIVNETIIPLQINNVMIVKYIKIHFFIFIHQSLIINPYENKIRK